MEGTVAGVRIVPPLVEFFDAETEVVHQMTLTVQNLSKCSRNIRYHGPATSVSTLVLNTLSFIHHINLNQSFGAVVGTRFRPKNLLKLCSMSQRFKAKIRY